MIRLRAKHPERSKLTDKEYSQLGRELEALLVKDYIEALHSTPRQIWNSFMRGTFTGLGGVLGATVGVALLLFVLQLLGSHLPLVGPFFHNLRETIQNKAAGH